MLNPNPNKVKTLIFIICNRRLNIRVKRDGTCLFVSRPVTLLTKTNFAKFEKSFLAWVGYYNPPISNYQITFEPLSKLYKPIISSFTLIFWISRNLHL